MRTFIENGKSLTIKDNGKEKNLKYKCEMLRISARPISCSFSQYIHTTDTASEAALTQSYDRNIEFIKKHSAIKNHVAECIVLVGEVKHHDLIRLFQGNGDISEREMSREISIIITKINLQDETYASTPMPSLIGIDSGSKFNGAEIISSPDDIPSLHVDIHTLPTQFESIKAKIAQNSKIDINLHVFCFADRGWITPSEWFRDEIFFCDTSSRGIDPICIIESISVTQDINIDRGSKNDDEDQCIHDDGGKHDPITNLTEYIESAERGIWEIKKTTDNILTSIPYQWIQVVILAYIAWKLF